jgi:hypothetical protein
LNTRSSIIWLHTLVIVALLASFGLATAAAAPSKIASGAPNNTHWTYQTVESYNQTGQYASLAFDTKHDRVDISYYSPHLQALKLAWSPYPGNGNCGQDNGWRCFTVDHNEDDGKYSSLAYNTAGEYWGIAYYDSTNGALKYSNDECLNNCNFRATTIDQTAGAIVGRGTSLKFDAKGIAHIAYYQAFPAALKYAHYVGGSAGNCFDADWQCDTIESGTAMGYYLSLDLDAIGRVHIAYYDGGTGTLKYASQVGSGGTGCNGGTVAVTWMCQVVDAPSGVDVGAFAWLHQSKCFLPGCVDPTQIAYYDATNHTLKYARYGINGSCSAGATPGWKCDTIETVGSWTSPELYLSMAVRNDGTPVIAYNDRDDGANGRLKLASPTLAVGNCGPNGGLFQTWQCDTLDMGNSLGGYRDVGKYPSIGINSAGLISVAYYDATNADLEVAIEKATQTITFNPNPLPNKLTTDPPFTLNASASSGLPVTFTASGKCSVNGNTVTLSGQAGTCTITAQQAGNTSYDAAPDVVRNFMVNYPAKQDQTISFAALPDKTLGDPPFSVAASASSGLPVSFTATGKCSVNGNTVTLSGQAGSCTITAHQAGNATYNPAPDVARSFAINTPAKQNQTINFAALPNKTLGDAPFSVSATASSGLPVSFTATGKCSVSGNTVTWSGQAGSCTITAHQAGNATYNAAPDVARSFAINDPAKQDQSISFAALPNKNVGDAPFPVSASASSGLAVTFTASGQCSISGNIVTLTGSGSCTITARQPGNATYNAAADVARGFQISASGPANSTVYLPLLVR